MKSLLLLIALPLFSLTFQEMVERGSPGDFVVYDQQRTYTALVIDAIAPGEIALEEISMPDHKKSETSWRDWLKSGAPGHTSWVRYRINTKENRLIEAYSFARKCWLPTEGNEPLVAILMRQELTPIGEMDRKRLGAKSGAVRLIDRPLWHPPCVVNGERVSQNTVAYTTLWPDDGSELSTRALDLYFDPAFPFPHWIETGSLRIRAVDSGKALALPQKETPCQAPTIVRVTRGTPDTLEIANPSALTAFTLYFTGKEGPILCPIHTIGKNCLTTTLPKEKGEITLIPDDHPHLSVDFQVPIE